MKSYQNKNLLPYDGEVYLIKSHFHSELNLDIIASELIWRNDKIKMFGKTFDQPRKVAFYGNKGISYTYSGIKMEARLWSKSLGKINESLKSDFGLFFNSVLVNLYRNGDDYMSYHQDNELELGKKPTIASVSFGETRDFYLRHISSQEIIKLKLEHGDVLIMQGRTQDAWKHSIPKRKRVSRPRLNLTFRNIINTLQQD